MTNNKILISIILNCYNGERYLKEALKSINVQSFKNWELIFWDNRSTDSSKKILFDTIKNKKKIKYFYSKKHTSLYAARNLAIKKAKGHFIGFIDSDDTWEKDKLLKQVKLFQDKNVGVVYGNSWLKKESNNKKRKFINYKMKSGLIYNDLINNYNVGILTALIKRELIKKKKKVFNDRYNIIGDYDLFIRLSKKNKFNVIQEPVATYRIHETNFSVLNKDIEIEEFNHWLNKNKSILSKKNYITIKKRVKFLEFLNLKFSKTFLSCLKFFVRSSKFIFNVKNIFILLLPKFFLKKIMWFN